MTQEEKYKIKAHSKYNNFINAIFFVMDESDDISKDLVKKLYDMRIDFVEKLNVIYKQIEDDEKKTIKSAANKCPLCFKDAHPVLSNGVAVEVPHFKEGKLIEYLYYHSHCIQHISTQFKPYVKCDACDGSGGIWNESLMVINKPCDKCKGLGKIKE